MRLVAAVRAVKGPGIPAVVRVKALFAVALLLVLFQAGRHLYRWYAYSTERETIDQMDDRVLNAGAAVVSTELRADSIHGVVQVLDRQLAVQRRTVDAYARHAAAGALAPHLYEAYRADVASFNERVQQRNAMLDAYKAMVVENYRAVSRYNTLADSIRRLAEEIGDPFYPVPLPAEAAAARGIEPPPPNHEPQRR